MLMCEVFLDARRSIPAVVNLVEARWRPEKGRDSTGATRQVHPLDQLRSLVNSYSSLCDDSANGLRVDCSSFFLSLSSRPG
jgi:hypothetical protein